MKVLILGLDGLDYDCVNRWNINEFKQKYFGKHLVNMLSHLYTPLIWGSFLIGGNVEDYGYDLKRLREKRALDGSHPLLRPLYKLRLKLFPNRKIGLRELLVRKGLAEKYPPSIMPKRLLKKTFLEVLKMNGYKVSAIEVPAYNEVKNEYFRCTFSKYLSKPLKSKIDYVEGCLSDVQDRVNKAMKFVFENYDVIFMYSHLPDIAHHLFFRNIIETKMLHDIYLRLKEITLPLIEESYSRDYAVLIISDHGFDVKKHYHSNYGFWSLNVEPPYEPKYITDFFKIIMSLVEL